MSMTQWLSLNSPDYGTPKRVSEKLVTLEIDGVGDFGARGHVGDGRGDGRRGQDSQAMRHR